MEATLSSKQLICRNINLTKYRYQWSVFCSSQESCVFESPTFRTLENDIYSFSWQLFFFRNTFFDNKLHKLSVKLASGIPPTEDRVSVQVECFIRNIGLDKPVFTAEFDPLAKLPIVKSAELTAHNDALNNFFRRNNYRRHEYDNNFQELEFLTEVQVGIKLRSEKNILKLSDDLERALKCDLLCDVTIMVWTKEFKAHMAILAARSPVFESMFTHDMKEKLTRRVEIIDIQPEIFNVLLQFIYTGTVPITDGLKWNQVLNAADKYQINDLKEICLLNMHKDMTVDNVIDIYLCAHNKKLEDLEAEAIDFIIVHKKEVAKSAAYKRMFTYDKKSLLEQVFYKISENDD